MINSLCMHPYICSLLQHMCVHHTKTHTIPLLWLNITVSIKTLVGNVKFFKYESEKNVENCNI